MSESTSHQPYQLGDVVDGHRWTITGWEPVAAPERTIGVPRLLQKRYEAAQADKARRQSGLRTLEPNAPVVTGEAIGVLPDDRPVVVLDPTDDIEALAAHDDGTGPADAEVDGVELPDDAVIDLTDGTGDAETPTRPGSEPAPITQLAVEDDSDAPFAAALALGVRRLAETYQPSELDIIAGSTAGATWPAAASAGAALSAPVAEDRTPSTDDAATAAPQPDSEPAPHVTYTQAPAAGWYPGSI